MANKDDNIIPFQRPASAGSLIEVGGPVDSVCVTLSMYGEHLDPDWVSHQLGVRPSSGYRKGDPRPTELPDHRSGGWFLEAVGDAPHTPETLTEQILAPLPAPTAEIWSTLAAHFDVQMHYALFLYSFNRGFSLSPSLVWRLAAMRVRIVYDIYAN